MKVETKIVAACLGVLAIAGAWAFYQRLLHSQRSIVIALPHEEGSALVWVAQEQGYFAREGLRVGTIELDKGQDTVGTLLGHGSPLMVASDTALVQASLRGERFRILTVLYSSKGDIKVMARKDHGIEGPRDLKGKTVGIAEGSNREFFLASFLLHFGLDPSQVTLVRKDPEALLDDLQKGRIDAACVPSPHAYQTQKNLGATGVAFSETLLYDDGFNLVADPAWLDGRGGELTEHVIRALHTAERFVTDHPAAARQIIAHRAGLGRDYLKETWSEMDFSLRLDQACLVRLEERARWIIKTGKKPRPIPDFRGAMDFKALKAISPERVDIVH